MTFFQSVNYITHLVQLIELLYRAHTMAAMRKQLGCPSECCKVEGTTMELSSWNYLSTLLTQYWSVPIGMAIVYYFAKYHFNTPDYVLINDIPPDAGG